MQHHTFYLSHDNGISKISTTATDREAARTLIMKAENCPARAVKDQPEPDQKINKAAALKRYAKGQPIFIQSSKMRPVNMWQPAIMLEIKPEEEEGPAHAQLEKILNEFRYYNCDRERGLAIHFYTAS